MFVSLSLFLLEFVGIWQLRTLGAGKAVGSKVALSEKIDIVGMSENRLCGQEWKSTLWAGVKIVVWCVGINFVGMCGNRCCGHRYYGHLWKVILWACVGIEFVGIGGNRNWRKRGLDLSIQAPSILGWFDFRRKIYHRWSYYVLDWYGWQEDFGKIWKRSEREEQRNVVSLVGSGHQPGGAWQRKNGQLALLTLWNSRIELHCGRPSARPSG